MMMWLFAIVIVLVMGAIAMIASGRGGSMDAAYPDRPDLVLPTDRPLVADDLRTVRFSLAVRGYRMSDVDALLDRLARELDHDADLGLPETTDGGREGASGDEASG